MNNSQAIPPRTTLEASPPLVIRTGRADCLAHFSPALYQLTLIKAGIEEKVDLGFSGSRLLERLLQTPGEVVAREELMNHAWSNRVVGQGSLNQQVYTLRQVLADEKTREIIQTLPRRGYMFNPNYLAPAPCTDAPAETLDSGSAPSSTDQPLLQPGKHRQLATLLASLALLGLGLLGYLYQVNSPTRLLSSELNIGKASVTYLGRDEQMLQQLIMQTRDLSTRMAGLTDKPVELVLGLSSGFYEVLCMQPGGPVRSLTFHESQLAALANEQLRRCLP